MSAKNRRSFFGNTSSEENTRILADPNASFRLLYWDVASVAASARDMLAYGNVKWTNQIPADGEWDHHKIPTPFGVMPVLNVISSDGKETFLTESIVIDHYLAKRFGLLGDNEWEEFTIKGIYNNIHYLRERSFMNVTWTFADKRKIALERFMNSSLPEFIANHEFHLKANGSNGHYIGNKLSLADVHLVNTMDHFSHLPSGSAIAAEFQKSEELMRVKKAVEQNPRITNWRASEECKVLAQGSIVCYAQTAVPE
ncbi:Glutathione S-transferase S1 [Haplosporangium sp. Z 27]|nr:Glutathione S-transferase S1 [Haplosporangium sp. Z 27]